ncbi:prepilin-type N-terminal cleavage/methylation domain-containing protein, partial [Acinetobacter baumannii]
MKSQSPLKSQKGFTLIEVMVVIVIMTIMTSLVVL